MARIRTLKPEFWTDDIIVELSFAARLFYQGYWNFALCDYGHSDATAKTLKMQIFPADDVNAEEIIEELVKWGRLIRKSTPDGRPYLHAATLSKHTKMDSRWNTSCPYCILERLAKPADTPPAPDELTETRASSDELTETRPREVKGREVKGSREGTRKRGTRLPEDFAVDASMRAWARDKAPRIDVDLETIKFINHFTSKTGANATKLNWVLTWQNWILRAVDFGGARASPPSADSPGMALFRPEDYD